jgi:hypothetical protein
MKPKTLRQIIEENPECADMPVGIMRTDGDLDYVGWSGSTLIIAPDDEDVDYEEWEIELGPVLVFAGN